MEYENIKTVVHELHGFEGSLTQTNEIGENSKAVG